ncbi:hypothetical protein CL614_02065 [archaeon]|nr:hypothetical protein [archaeon]
MEYIIGIKSILKNVKDGKISKIVVASNCPQELIDRVLSVSKVEIEKFEDNQRKLGTSIGKPFPVAMIGYLK